MGVVMMHEQEPGKGGCPFRRFFQQTPEVLLKKHRLFDTVAVPLYPSYEHRVVSLRYALRDVGAVEIRHSRTCRWKLHLFLGSIRLMIAARESITTATSPLGSEVEVSTV